MAHHQRLSMLAVELFLAEKTIESTLSSVYRKLGVHTRVRLAAALEANDVT
ncbi:LuxR C-terminal-related transcriptional regulator [Mycobacterium sp. SMC-11]|uniref:LuxR C-terminal-related transcriptional regulator n=1 Tax=Mycobacterium sp. SMC-11 TaxID=3385969 RepID=UPI00390C78F1